jgi:regulator of nucleoside diphosphate kinase
MPPAFVFTDADRRRLGQLLDSNDSRASADREVLDELEWQLEECESMPQETISDTVVTMNSKVRLISMVTDAECRCTVVYPEDVDLVNDAVSVLSSLGSGLIGCRVGDLVEFEEPCGRGPWQVAEIVFQPERNGDFHL